MSLVGHHQYCAMVNFDIERSNTAQLLKATATTITQDTNACDQHCGAYGGYRPSAWYHGNPRRLLLVAKPGPRPEIGPELIITRHCRSDRLIPQPMLYFCHAQFIHQLTLSSSILRSFRLPLKSRDITVPIDTPVTDAISE